MKTKRVFFKIFKLGFKTSPNYYITFIAKALISTFLVIFNSFYISFIIEQVANNDFNNIINNIIFVIGIDILANAINKILTKYDEYQLEILTKKILKELTSHLHKVEYKYLEDPHYEEVRESAKYAITSQDAIYSMFNFFTLFLTNLITILSLVTSLALISPILLAVIGVCFILTVLIKLISHNKVMKFFEDLVPINRNVSHFLNILLHPRYQKDLRMYPLGTHMQNVFIKYNDQIVNKFIYICKFQSVILSMSRALNYIELTIIYLIIAYKTLIQNMFSVATFTLQINLSTSLATNLSECFGNLVQVLRYRSIIKPVVELLELKEVDNINKLELKEVNELEFKNVYFKYPKTDKLILDNVSFRIKQGDKIALVGLNGAGKSTIVKLICRLYDIDKGEILINGININEYDLDSYYKTISTVFQDYKIFGFSLKDNILIGKDKDINPIINELGLDKVIDKLPNKLDSIYSKQLAEDGIELSGGETQKIAIARCLATNANFVILDEPTSALDPIAEANIYANFKDLAKERTAIYISHRLASAIFCDKVLVLDGGKITDFAPHSELIKNSDSLYTKLFNLQKENYQED